MGTLTADVPRLSDHCDHKLATSCRLTSTPKCCACYDNRPHSSTYRVYIDGVGFVSRGTRWQSYCWYCKEFWNTRVKASSIPINQTRIPSNPDQTAFLARWFEFYQGYRVVRSAMNGLEERVAVVGEPLKDVDPGHLPRTLDELRTGRGRDQHAHSRISQQRVRETRETTATTRPEPSLDQTLDQLLEEAIAEADPPANEQIPAEDTAVSQNIPATLDNSSSDQAATPPRDHPFGPDYSAALSRVREAERRRAERVGAAEAATNEENSARAEARRLRREHIARGNFTRVFGTREDIQSDDYVSPITNMFTRVSQWGRRNEQQRQAFANFEEMNRQRQFHEAENNAEPPPTRRRNSLGRLTRGLAGLNRTSRHGVSEEVRSPGEPLRRSPIQLPIPDPPASATAEFLRRRNSLGRLLRTRNEDSGNMPVQNGLETASSGVPNTETWMRTSLRDARALASERLNRRLLTVSSYISGVLANDAPMDPDARSRIYEIQERIEELRAAPSENADINEQMNEVQMLLREVDRYNVDLSRRQQDTSPTMRHALSGLDPARINDMNAYLNSARARFASRVMAAQTLQPPSPIKGLDTDDTRPEPKSDEEMAFKLECKVCLTQVADTACLPCGHLAMCTWCADQIVPTREEDRTRPREKDIKCPVCRVRVKQRVRIYAT